MVKFAVCECLAGRIIGMGLMVVGLLLFTAGLLGVHSSHS